MSKDLLREAIADAKAVKETAYANAKLALEEALAPHIQSMISAKLSEEMDSEEEKKDESVQAEGEEYGTDDMKKVKDLKEEEKEDEDKKEMKEEDSTEKDDEKLHEEEEEEMDEDLDLEAIIRELEEELASSQIGSGENKEPSDDASAASTEDPGHGDHVKHETPKMMSEEGEDEKKHDEGYGEDMDEKKHLNIEDIINALRELTEEEEEEEEEKEDASEYAMKMETLESDLKEAYDVINFLRTQINEVNLLNAKLLYSNKLFKKYDLNEAQKAKVIDNFDRAKSVREVKLVFTTLAEAFHGNKSKPLTIKESFVSNPIPSTKPAEKSREIISESESVERFKKLAGLK